MKGVPIIAVKRAFSCVLEIFVVVGMDFAIYVPRRKFTMNWSDVEPYNYEKINFIYPIAACRQSQPDSNSGKD